MKINIFYYTLFTNDISGTDKDDKLLTDFEDFTRPFVTETFINKGFQWTNKTFSPVVFILARICVVRKR